MFAVVELVVIRIEYGDYRDEYETIVGVAATREDAEKCARLHAMKVARSLEQDSSDLYGRTWMARSRQAVPAFLDIMSSRNPWAETEGFGGEGDEDEYLVGKVFVVETPVLT